MAVGEITYDNSMPVIAGNRKVIHGTIEVDNTGRGFAICDSKSTLVHASLEDEEGVLQCQVDLNQASDQSTLNGSLRAIHTTGSTNTFRYRVEFI